MPPKIADLWESYRKRVLPANAGAVQVEETRRGFYAGCAGLFGLITNHMSPGEEITEADVAVLDAIQRELDEYLAAFKVQNGVQA